MRIDILRRTTPFSRHRRATIMSGSLLVLSACATLPSGGPSSRAIARCQNCAVGDSRITLVDLTAPIVSRAAESNQTATFAERLGDGEVASAALKRGDIVNIEIWEAPPAVLFGGGLANIGSGASAGRNSVTLEQMIDNDGRIMVPFAGRLLAAGKTPVQLGSAIDASLAGKAHDPQTVVRVTRASSSSVTVIGEVASSTRVPLTPKGERLLDALAAAGGTRQAVGRMTLQITRGTTVATMPLEAVIADPHQNIRMQSDDVLTAIYQPFSFTSLGATGKNEEVQFEATGITLSQALGRVSGLQDMRADIRGVFVFRMEAPQVIDPTSTAKTLMPVIYRIDLHDPSMFFLAQRFPIRNKDILYVSNAPLADVQKFVSVIASSILPVATTAAVIP